MKISEIRIDAQLHISREISPQYTLKYVREALMNLTKYDTSMKKADTTIVIDSSNKGTWIDLPADFVAVKECTKGGARFTEYAAELNQIRIYQEGEYILTYLKYPTMPQTETQEPDIPAAYHYAISYFIAAKEVHRLYGVDPNYENNMMLFEQQAYDAHVLMSGQKRTARKMAAPRWG